LGFPRARAVCGYTRAPFFFFVFLGRGGGGAGGGLGAESGFNIQH
jgi:hypothetical protein